MRIWSNCYWVKGISVFGVIYFITGALGSFRSYNWNERISQEQLVKEIREDSSWYTWKWAHKKTYKTWLSETESYRIWRDNLIQINFHNEKFKRGEETYQKSLNGYSDMYPSEVIGRTVWRRPRLEHRDVSKTMITQQEIPDSIDWRGTIGMLGQIKVQGFNPHGWLFTSLEVVQSQLFRNTGERFTLSSQELLDCLKDYGYNHGSIVDAILYIKERGISLERIYPYCKRKPRFCKAERYPVDCEIQSVHQVAPANEENLKLAVAVVGPIAVNIRVTENFVNYFSGVFYDKECKSGLPARHAVLVVGYGTDPASGDYWVIKNSWGSFWGERGYMRLARNTFYNCGIATAAFYPTLS